MVRNSMKFVLWCDYQTVGTDLKRVSQSVAQQEALSKLDQLDKKGQLNTRK